MLDILRANKGSLIAWVFLGAIIVVFVVSFGPGSFARGSGCAGGGGSSYAARVNGKTIAAGDFERQYGQMLRMFQQQTGQPLSKDLAEKLGLRQAALNQLVDKQLVVEEALRRGLVVSDQELSDAVHEMPTFQEGGRFNYDVYQRTVAAYYGSPSRFEAGLRDDLAYQKMMAAVRETVKVSDAEVKAAWLADADKVDLSFVRIPLAAAQAAAKPSEAEAKAFATANADRVKKFYEENAARYDQQRKLKARHILVRVAPNAPAGEEEAARRRAEALAARVQKGEDFGKVAREASDDENTKAAGGELGYVAEGLVEKPFSDAAFALEKGQVSAPVRTRAGFELVQAEEVVPAKKVSLDEARLDIARELLGQEKGKKLAEERARAALAAAGAGHRLADQFPAADAKGKTPVKLGGTVIAADETGPVSSSAGTFLPKLGAVPGLLEDALAAKAGDVLPKVYASAQGPVVAVVKSREKPDPAAFEAARGQLSTRLRNRKESQVEQAWLKELRAGADVKVNEALVRAAAPVED